MQTLRKTMCMSLTKSVCNSVFDVRCCLLSKLHNSFTTCHLPKHRLHQHNARMGAKIDARPQSIHPLTPLLHYTSPSHLLILIPQRTASPSLPSLAPTPSKFSPSAALSSIHPKPSTSRFRLRALPSRINTLPVAAGSLPLPMYCASL